VPHPSYLKILLAEDSPQEKLLLEEAFAAQNVPMELVWVTDGQQAAEILAKSPLDQLAKHYDLILLDAYLPLVSGEEILLQLQRESRKLPVPVVVISGLIADSARLQFEQLGATAVFSKPFDLDEYSGLIQELLEIAGR
jgi:DNA-binding response OmpR family regulator